MDHEIIDISDDFDVRSRSNSFGGGIELLMNSKKTTGGGDSSVELNDIHELEKDLNELASATTSTSNGFNGSMFSGATPAPSVRFEDTPNIGKSTANIDDSAKTWDGYGRFNNIPVNPDVAPDNRVSKEELFKEKIKYLRKIGRAHV